MTSHNIAREAVLSPSLPKFLRCIWDSGYLPERAAVPGKNRVSRDLTVLDSVSPSCYRRENTTLTSADRRLDSRSSAIYKETDRTSKTFKVRVKEAVQGLRKVQAASEEVPSDKARGGGKEGRTDRLLASSTTPRSSKFQGPFTASCRRLSPGPSIPATILHCRARSPGWAYRTYQQGPGTFSLMLLHDVLPHSVLVRS